MAPKRYLIYLIERVYSKAAKDRQPPDDTFGIRVLIFRTPFMKER